MGMEVKTLSNQKTKKNWVKSIKYLVHKTHLLARAEILLGGQIRGTII